jgi:hypothetical protein
MQAPRQRTSTGTFSMTDDDLAAERPDGIAMNDGAFRGRRITWAEFYRKRPDLRPANDDRKKEAA